MDDTNAVTTRLLTLLNVSATKVDKRKRSYEDDPPPEKLNKRKSIRFSDSENHSDSPAVTEVVVEEEEAEVQVPEDVEEELDGKFCAYDRQAISHFCTDTAGLYERHFGVKPTLLTEPSRAAIDKNARVNSREQYGKLGSVLVEIPEGDTGVDVKHTTKNDVSRHQVCHHMQKLKIPDS